MASLKNIEENISLSINLMNNDFLDVDLRRDDYENWIPFTLSLNAENENYCYSEDKGATLSLYELRSLITMIEKIIKKKYAGFTIDRYEFFSCECYFELTFFETEETDLVYLEIWINIGTYSEGISYGYDKGFRFVSTLKSLENFKKELKSQLNLLINL